MANYLSTLGSDINVLMLCAVNMEIDGKAYMAGEPFTFLKGVTAAIDSQSITAQNGVATPTNRGLKILDSIQYLDQIVLNNVPYTKKVQSLFFNKHEASNYENFEWSPLTVAQTKLRAMPTQIFVYKNGDLLNDSEYTITQLAEAVWLTINDFDDAAQYMVGYSYVDDRLVAFQSQNYPYFKLVLYIKGNVANKTSDQVIVLEKVSLIPQTVLNFLPNAQNFVTLNFGIIDAEKTVRLKI